MLSPRTARRPAAAGAAILALVVLLPTVAGAVEYTAARKVGRGLASMTTCFLEVPGNMVKMTRERGYGWGFTLGFATGVGKLIPRVLVGVYEFVSAPFPLPAGYKPILEPEFPWGYFEEPPPQRR
jgi:putative exosortase-associated protein (TIGR04073 family)